jgi:hypothetical protein
MASTWTIKANDRVYGPYTADQMRSYVGEGRLAAHTLVARTGEKTYRPAGDDDEIAVLFKPAPTPQRPVFFTAEGDLGPQTFGRTETTSAAAHFIIIADMKSRSISGVEEEIFKCGQAYAIMPQAWLLSSEMSINAIRNALVQRLGRIDMLFVIDATRNKAAWFNYGPEADSRIRRIWQKVQEQQAAE